MQDKPAEEYCLHTIQTDIQLMKQDLHSVKELVENNIESDSQRLKKHGEQIDNLTVEIATMKGKSMGSNNLGSFVLSAAIVVVMILQIFFN